MSRMKRCQLETWIEPFQLPRGFIDGSIIWRIISGLFKDEKKKLPKTSFMARGFILAPLPRLGNREGPNRKNFMAQIRM